MARPAKKKSVKLKPTAHRQDAQQKSSKETVQRIIESAMALTAEKGETVTMSEIAKRSGVVIGALYRYFADKNAINKAMLLQHYAQVDARRRERISSCASPNEFIATMQKVYELYFEMHQRDPLYRNIWALVQTDAE